MLKQTLVKYQRAIGTRLNKCSGYDRVPPHTEHQGQEFVGQWQRLVTGAADIPFRARRKNSPRVATIRQGVYVKLPGSNPGLVANHSLRRSLTSWTPKSDSKHIGR